ncbi:MAG: hypothetical protein PHU83_06825 [Eubacteriales bacterium]|nr:hypothetical protein [Eubacteriales bacterium]
MRKGFKSSALILSVFLLLTVMTACSPIEDTNGTSDKTLAQITDSELATKVSGSISKGSSSMKGTPTINREINDDIISDDDYDYDEIEFDFTRLNGTVKAMAAYLRVGDKMTVDFSSQVTSGNFAAVIVSPDKTILKRFEADESGSANITASSEGDHFVIIAGESAAGSVSVIRSFEQEG